MIVRAIVRIIDHAAMAFMLIFLLTACATREVLPFRSAIVPNGVDISGNWRLRAESSTTNQRLDDAELTAAGGRERLSKSSRNKSRNISSLVHVFLESGQDLKITQTEFGIFISFDRSIVEEYRFGEHREVNVGPVVADRSSGWEEGAYVIDTLDADGNKLRERYQLEQDGQLLLRQITIWKKNSIDLSLVQKFDKT